MKGVGYCLVTAAKHQNAQAGSGIALRHASSSRGEISMCAIRHAARLRRTHNASFTALGGRDAAHL